MGLLKMNTNITSNEINEVRGVKIQKILLVIKTNLELHTPIRTGRLMAGWTFVVDDVEYENLDIPSLKVLKTCKNITLYNKRDYAVYVIDTHTALRESLESINLLLEKEFVS